MMVMKMMAMMMTKMMMKMLIVMMISNGTAMRCFSHLEILVLVDT